MSRKMMLGMMLVGVVVIFVSSSLLRHLDNQRRHTELNATLAIELKKLDSIGGVSTATTQGGARVILPIKSLSREWLIDTEESLMLNLAEEVMLCGNSRAPIVAEAKKMKWYSKVKVEYSATCP